MLIEFVSSRSVIQNRNYSDLKAYVKISGKTRLTLHATWISLLIAIF